MDDLSFANAALNKVGESRLTTLDNTNGNAKIETVNAHLEATKLALLRLRDWNCARRRAQMEISTSDGLGEYEKAYFLPIDCVAVRRFIGTNDADKYARFSIEVDGDGRRILFTDDGTDKIVYTASVNIGLWDGLLVAAGIEYLAHEFAIAFGRDFRVASAIWEKYERKIDEASGVDESEGGVEHFYDKTLVTVRL